MTPEPIAWLTVADVAERLGLSCKSVYVLTSPSTAPERRLVPHRMGAKGGRLRFDPAVVEAYIASMRETVTPPRREYSHLFQRSRPARAPRRS